MKIKFHRDARRSKEEVGGMKVPYAAAKRATPKLRWYLILLGVSAPLIILLTGLIGRSVSMTADGNIALQRYELRAAAAGYVQHVNVMLQSNVDNGVVVVRLQDPELDATLARARAELSAMQGDALGVAPAVASGRDRRAELALLEQTLAHQRGRLTTIRDLFRAGAATAAEVNEVTAATQQAELAVLQLRDAMRNRALPRDVNERERRRLLADIEGLEQKRQKLAVRAPHAGRVIDLFANPGEYVAAGAPLVLIGDATAPQIQVYLEPRFATQLDVGSVATVRFPDGTRGVATVVESGTLTKRLPAEMVDRGGARPMTVLLNLVGASDWPPEMHIHGLPVRVRFHYDWEDTPLGAWVGRALAWLSRYG
ncbi:MAG TPA: efflux RND transporter periplasmic adaptor subunit [Steroidobacteraceae bacterium]|nr:efflux RND transporter periplasmic adaptor subunit [Steroidobacteraceae bacterium]HRX90841.1 efflux RND transporter periplasmic adaptor subunit [Steroidobacteraceae bacterium]